MPRLAGTGRYRETVAAAVDPALKRRLANWAAHQQCSRSALLRALIEQHIPDLRRLTRRHSPVSPDGPATPGREAP